VIWTTKNAWLKDVHNAQPLIEHLKMVMGETEEDDIIEFSQWKTTDRLTLVQQQETIADYINLVMSQLQKLIAHSYIAKCI